MYLQFLNQTRKGTSLSLIQQLTSVSHTHASCIKEDLHQLKNVFLFASALAVLTGFYANWTQERCFHIGLSKGKMSGCVAII